jgi:hypothetical protein
MRGAKAYLTRSEKAANRIFINGRFEAANGLNRLAGNVVSQPRAATAQ